MNTQLETQKQIRANTTTAQEEARNKFLTNKILEMQLPNIKKETNYKSRQWDSDSAVQDFNNINKTIQEGLGTLGSGKDLINPLKGVLKLPADFNSGKQGYRIEEKLNRSTGEIEKYYIPYRLNKKGK